MVILDFTLTGFRLKGDVSHQLIIVPSIYGGITTSFGTAMSLRQADDKSTAEIMKLFYELLAKSETKDEASRSTKPAFLFKSDPLISHPYFWEAFIANGDMAPLKNTNKWPIAHLWIRLLSLVLLIILHLLFLHRNKYLVR